MKVVKIAALVFAHTVVAVAGERVLLWPEGKMPDAVHAWRCGCLVCDELGKGMGEDATDGHWVRLTYTCARVPLLPAHGIAGNWQLHVDGARLGVPEPQKI